MCCADGTDIESLKNKRSAFTKQKKCSEITILKYLFFAIIFTIQFLHVRYFYDKSFYIRFFIAA